jgi:hypothetical protein
MMNENKYLEKAIRYFTTEGLSMSMEEIAQGIGVTKRRSTIISATKMN